MYSFLTVFFLLLVAAFCAYSAKLRGRNPFAWFVIGLFFGAIGFLVLYLLPSKKNPFTFTSSIPNSIQASSKVEKVPTENTTNPPSSTALPSVSQKLWYYLNEENERFGPMGFKLLKQAWIEDQISRETYVWNEDMENWKPVKEVLPLIEELGDMNLS